MMEALYKHQNIFQSSSFGRRRCHFLGGDSEGRGKEEIVKNSD